MNFVSRLFLAATLILSACGGRTGSAPTLPNGSKVSVLVTFDDGVTDDMAADRKQQIQQLATWMKDDLIAILDKTGYSAVLVADPSQAQAGPGRYVLRVNIADYNAGSKAARMLVGFGAGAATLTTHFDLLDDQGAVLVAGDPSVGSGRDWKNAARKVNLLTVDPVNNHLNATL